MPSYTTILVLALAVSNVSPALSAPILYSRQVREQSLSHRGPKIGAPLSKRVAWGKLLKKVAIDLGIGTASTVAGYAILDKMTGPSPSSSEEPPATEPVPASSGTAPAAPPSAPPISATPAPATSGPPPAAGPPPGYATSAPPPGNATTGPAPGPATPGPAPVSATPPPTGPNNANSANNGDNSNSSVFGRSVSNENRHATSALELLSRTDLEETLKLFKRILDELD